MQNFDRHFYLYAKGHYEKKCTTTELIKIQSKRCGTQEARLTLRDVNTVLVSLAHRHVQHRNAFKSFIDFIISNHANQGGVQLAISKACLSIFNTVKTSEIGFDLGEADPDVLPLASDKEKA